MEEIVIIGSGIAGYSAAMCLNQLSCGYKLITGNINNIGGQLNKATQIENYPGAEVGISGINFMNIVKNDVGTDNFVYDEVIDVDFFTNIFKIKTNKELLESKSVIICTGKSYNKLNITNEDFYVGKGISYCVMCDSFLYRNKNVCVVGGGDSAIRGVIHLSKIAKNVHLLVRSDKLRANNKLVEGLNECQNVIIHYNTTIQNINGENYVESIDIIKNREHTRLDIDCIFVMIGSTPNTDIFSKYIDLDNNGYIITDAKNETNIKGIFAGGDVQSNTYKQAIIAAGNGYNAAINAYYYVKSIQLK